MTSREFFSAIAATETLATELRAYATGEIAKLDARNTKRKNTLSKAAVENAAILDRLVAAMSDGKSRIAAELAEMVGTTPNKVTHICGEAVKNGRMVAVKVKSPAKSGGKINSYSLAVSTAEGEE